MAFRQLFKCISCNTTDKSKQHESFSFFAMNEISDMIFDQEDDQQMNEEISDILPGLTKTEANEILIEIWNHIVYSKKINYEKELNLRMFIHKSSSKIFRWSQCTTNDNNNNTKLINGRSLWIALYGCNIPTNEEEIKLNENSSIWIIQYCSTDWQQEYIDLMLDRLIEHHIIVNEVNPNRIFLIGISPSGGDGVYQLAPRMADRWAAAGIMAGHPNDVSPLSLRNLPFALFMTEQNNNEQNRLAAHTWAKLLDDCSREHISGGYPFWIKIGYGEEQKANALAWMNKHTRNPWPTRLIWHYQGYVSHTRFYWLSLPFPEQIKKGQTIIAEVKDRRNIYLEQIPNEIKILIIRLSDKLVNLDQSVTVNINRNATTTKIFHGIVPRTRAAIDQSIEERADPTSAATALLHVIWNLNTSIISCHSPIDTELTCPLCSHQTNEI